MTEREDDQRRRAILRREYSALYDTVSAILFAEDPMEINFDTNTDEYEPEVDTILPRLRKCSSVSDVHDVVYDEFIRWFGADIVGPLERYRSSAEKIWAALQRSQLPKAER